MTDETSSSAAAAYRKMLVDLDKGLRPRDLETMKFLCTNEIPVRKREEIGRALKLWEVLEERELLSPLNTSFLKKLIKHLGGREDLLNVVSLYEQNLFRDTTTRSNCLVKDMDIVIESINYRRWRSLARRLGLSDQVIDNLTEKYQNSIQEQVRQALTLWSKGENASRETLVQALRGCDMNMIAHTIETSVQQR